MGTDKTARQDRLNKLRIPDKLYTKLRLEAKREGRSSAAQLAAILAGHFTPRSRAEAPAPVVQAAVEPAPSTPKAPATPWTPLRHLRVAARDLTVEEVMKLDTGELGLMSRALTKLAGAEATAAARRITALGD
jgi:hypothetical protein